MKRLRIPLLVLLFSLLLAACGADGLYSLTLITEGQHELTQNIQGDLLILGGEVTLPENTSINGNVHLLLGALTVNGKINGDVSFMNGDLSLGDSALLRGDLNLGGGSFRPSPGSVIEGKVNIGTGVSLPSVPERERRVDWSFWFRTILNGLLSGLIASALVRYFPSEIGRISEAITHHSLASGAMGILTGIVGMSLLVTMAYTILLIPVSILMLFLLAAGVFLGWVGLGSELGRFLVKMTRRPIKPSKVAFIGMFVFMPAFQLFTSIPLLGGALGIALGSVGLGAVSLTRFGLRRFVPATDERNNI
jgi:cytoskeletal protein CcmA (bactofilin family)